MDFDVVKSEAMLQLNSLDENRSAILLIMNESGTGYKAFNINVSDADRGKMLLQESVNMLKGKEDENNGN